MDNRDLAPGAEREGSGSAQETPRDDIPLVQAQQPSLDYTPFSQEESPWTAQQFQRAHAVFLGGLHTISTPRVNIEKQSIDGAVVLMPQVARSLGWHQDVAVLAMTSWFVNLLQIVACLLILLYIDKEEHVFDAFAGQPFLCDFGFDLDQCVDNNNPSCSGPGGTSTTAPRLYSFAQWTTRNFVRDSLLALLPDRANDIHELVDPGEYAMESYFCRWLCCFLFVLSIKDEMNACMQMIQLLWYLPNRNEPWVIPKKCDPNVVPTGYTWTEFVEVKVAGMSLGWKTFNVFFVLLPKVSLVYLTTRAGTVFLMDTSSIDDIIVNSVAIGFILELDTLLTNSLLSSRAQQIIDMCEARTIESKNQNWFMSDGELLQRFNDSRGSWKSMFCNFFTKELVAVYIVLGVTVGSVMSYYIEHCELKDGRWVSQEIHVPKSTRYWGRRFLFPYLFSEQSDEAASWSYPE